MTTLKHMLEHSVANRPHHVAFQYKPGAEWKSMTYAQFQQQVWRVAEQLAKLGVAPGDRVGIYFENAIQWPVCYFAIVGLGGIAVPVDAKLREQEISHVLRDSRTAILVTTIRQLPAIRNIQDKLPDLRHILVIGGKDRLPSPSQGIAYHDYDQALDATESAALAPGRTYDQRFPAPDDVASFIYTSGTTGRQKGAMLTHRNFVANVESCRQTIAIFPSENFLLVLPLHHAFAFTGNLLLPLACATTISIVQSLRTVGENIQEVSPTAFIGVPLLVEKMHDRILTNLKNSRLGYLLYRAGIRGPVRRAIRTRLGGRLRIVITGGAPCDPRVLEGFRTLGILILEGYGLTETAPVLSLNPEHAPRPGTIGKPLVGIEISIQNPDADGIGEIKARGPNVMKGYFNDPEATREAFDGDWFLTGDLGFIDPDGYITITGRKKSLIVNREGKNIYPEEVEAMVNRSPYIHESLVLGYREPADNVGERVGIIVVPEQERLDEESARSGAVRTDQELLDLLRSEVRTYSGELAGFKRPRKIQVRMGEFEKTSTEKIKRYLYDLDDADV